MERGQPLTHHTVVVLSELSFIDLHRLCLAIPSILTPVWAAATSRVRSRLLWWNQIGHYQAKRLRRQFAMFTQERMELPSTTDDHLSGTLDCGTIGVGSHWASRYDQAPFVADWIHCTDHPILSKRPWYCPLIFIHLPNPGSVTNNMSRRGSCWTCPTKHSPSLLVLMA